MSRKARLAPTSVPATSPSARATPQSPGTQETDPGRRDSYRESIESLAIALILALLIRSFLAEAFVIPTGSMAPTLMGRHKDVTCPECGFVYTVNASEEEEVGLSLLGGGDSSDSRSRRVAQGTCVNCRFTASVDEQQTFKGDRILVNKFVYDLPFLPGAHRPGRWDVVVFKYPEEPEVNYIKRLVGLPGEELMIHQGDVYTRKAGSDDEFRIARKPLFHQNAMMIVAHDDRRRPKVLANHPEWNRWSGAWNEASPGHFKPPAQTTDPAVLSYHHLVPDDRQWRAILLQSALPHPPRPTLITDFYAYNTSVVEGSLFDEARAWFQPDWVGDLSLEFQLKVENPVGWIRIELIRTNLIAECRVDLQKGTITLVQDGKEIGQARQHSFRAGGAYSLRFANVDGRLTLELDGRDLSPNGEGWAYRDNPTENLGPGREDLSPARITAQGALIEVSDLVLKRDIYYTQSPGNPDAPTVWSPAPATLSELHDFLADPSRFSVIGRLQSSRYAIGEQRYMMLGDNSPRSKDGRGWGTRDRLDTADALSSGWDPSNRESWEVPESLLIGKAFFVYWPHGQPFGPTVRINRDFRLPFRPNFERMTLIR